MISYYFPAILTSVGMESGFTARITKAAVNDQPGHSLDKRS